MKPDNEHLLPVQILSIYPYPDVETCLVFLKGREDKVVPISIGDFEGKALAIAMQKIPPPRPLPHNLLQNLLEKIDGKVHQLVIHTLKDDVFHAYLLVQADDEVFYLDCRPSDGMILATLMGVPIFMSPEVMEEAGKELGDHIEMSEEAEGESDLGGLEVKITKSGVPHSQTTAIAGIEEGEPSELDKLKAQLDRLVAEEAYEEAAKVRDQISRIEEK